MANKYQPYPQSGGVWLFPIGMDCIAGLIPASSNNTEGLRTAPRGGVLNPLAGIKHGSTGQKAVLQYQK
jgi:hypothetical protein